MCKIKYILKINLIDAWDVHLTWYFCHKKNYKQINVMFETSTKLLSM